jgi:hypothetical protein
MQRLRWVLVMLCMACAPAAAADPYLSDVIKKPAYARALTRLLDSAGKLPGWTPKVRKINTEQPRTRIAIGGITYEMFFTCKPHDCNDNQMVVMFAPNGVQAWGALREGKRIRYFGGPSDAQQTALKEALAPID